MPRLAHRSSSPRPADPVPVAVGCPPGPARGNGAEHCDQAADSDQGLQPVITERLTELKAADQAAHLVMIARAEFDVELTGAQNALFTQSWRWRER